MASNLLLEGSSHSRRNVTCYEAGAPFYWCFHLLFAQPRVWDEWKKLRLSFLCKGNTFFYQLFKFFESQTLKLAFFKIFERLQPNAIINNHHHHLHMFIFFIFRFTSLNRSGIRLRFACVSIQWKENKGKGMQMRRRSENNGNLNLPLKNGRWEQVEWAKQRTRNA